MKTNNSKEIIGSNVYEASIEMDNSIDASPKLLIPPVKNSHDTTSEGKKTITLHETEQDEPIEEMPDEESFEESKEQPSEPFATEDRIEESKQDPIIVPVEPHHSESRRDSHSQILEEESVESEGESDHSEEFEESEKSEDLEEEKVGFPHINIHTRETS